MREPEVALAFTPDAWVEDLHRHLSDHGGARVRTLVVDSGVMLDEEYDVLVAGHRWVALTRALVDDVHGRGRTVLGVFDPEEPPSRAHLLALGVDAVVEADAGADGFVRAIVAVAAVVPRDDRSAPGPEPVAARDARVVTVGGPPGSGRTEIALQLAIAMARRTTAVLADADDVAPALAQRLHLPVEPNLRTAIEAVEHGRGELAACLAVEPASGISVLMGLPSAAAWTQIRPGEVLRVVDRLGAEATVIVVDGAGALDDVPATPTRGRNATARALVREADVLVAVCDSAPHGITRLLNWVVDARVLGADAVLFVVVNRAPGGSFRRGELYEEITSNLAVADVVFVGHDPRVGAAAWNGTPVARGPFTRAVDGLAAGIAALPPRRRDAIDQECAS